ncbi:MAG: EAL domain-containing protein, partial [Proteobacteria bacterium]|nr:EAL domain-containing protein [Pseudomonadota bacterium]
MAKKVKIPNYSAEAFLALTRRAAAVLDKSGHIMELNAAFADVLGRPTGRLRGRLIASLFSEEKERIGTLLADGIAFDVVARLSTRRQAVDVRLRLQCWRNQRGKINGWLATLSLGQDEQPLGNGGKLDPLTGLPGPEMLSERLANILARGGEAAVLCADLDGFDAVNAAHGRAVGDNILIETGKRISQSLRAHNSVGRLIEDAFVVILPEASAGEHVNAVAQRLILALSVPFDAQGVSDPVRLSASVGIAFATGKSTDPGRVLENAHQAAKSAKQGGRGMFQFYRGKTKSPIRERRSMVGRLKRAADLSEFRLVYQPKVMLASGRIVGAEALVRWHPPRGGVVMPGKFIPLAEDAGLIDRIGEIVMRQACQTLVAWRAEGLAPIRLAVNVSAREIARRSFLDDLTKLFAETGAEPEMIEIEITESAVMERAEDVISALREIRRLGVHLTADDFGTGYASLGYLRDFPLDGIKIDISFVAAIDDPKIGGGLAAAVIAVGRCLGMNVVAEGVETPSQLDFLRRHDCGAVQG